MEATPAPGQHPHTEQITPEPLLPVNPMAVSASSSMTESGAGVHLFLYGCRCEWCESWRQQQCKLEMAELVWREHVEVMARNYRDERFDC